MIEFIDVYVYNKFIEIFDVYEKGLKFEIYCIFLLIDY